MKCQLQQQSVTGKIPTAHIPRKKNCHRELPFFCTYSANVEGLQMGKKCHIVKGYVAVICEQQKKKNKTPSQMYGHEQKVCISSLQ